MAEIHRRSTGSVIPQRFSTLFFQRIFSIAFRRNQAHTSREEFARGRRSRDHLGISPIARRALSLQVKLEGRWMAETSRFFPESWRFHPQRDFSHFLLRTCRQVLTDLAFLLGFSACRSHLRAGFHFMCYRKFIPRTHIMQTSYLVDLLRGPPHPGPAEDGVPKSPHPGHTAQDTDGQLEVGNSLGRRVYCGRFFKEIKPQTAAPDCLEFSIQKWSCCL